METVNHVLDFTKLSGNAKAGGVENIIHRTKSVHHSLVSLLQRLRSLIRVLMFSVFCRFRRVDLMQLVEEATEGCWIGHRARMFTSEIGSVYSPPKPSDLGRQPPTSAAALSMSGQPKMVETVIDIGYSPSVRFVIPHSFILSFHACTHAHTYMPFAIHSMCAAACGVEKEEGL